MQRRAQAFVLGFITALSPSIAIAQAQTGTIIRHPGEPIRGPVATPVPPSQPDLTPQVLAKFNGTILLRREPGIFLVRSGAKSARLVLRDVYSASLSPDATQIAYFKEGQVRLLSLKNDEPQSETVVEELPGAKVEDIGWSPDGSMLAYDVQAKSSRGVHVFSLASHSIQKLSPGPGAISFSSDGKYVLGTDKSGLVRNSLLDGSWEMVYRTGFPPNWAARFNSNGQIGVLMPVPQPASNAADDDEPDCSGAQIQLDIVDGSGKATTLPFPQGFDNVYDFDFSRDGQQVVVGFGTVGCDYPGDNGAVYLISLNDGQERRLTRTGIALKGKFSPDGKQVAYTDFTFEPVPESQVPTVMITDLATGKSSLLLAPDNNAGIGEVIDWR